MLIKTGIFLPEPRKTNVSSQEKNNKPPQKTAHSHSDNQSTLTWKTDWISLIISEKLKCSPALLFVWLLKMKQKPATVKRELSMRQNVFQLYLFGCLSCGYLVYRVIAILFACVQGSEPSIKKSDLISKVCQTGCKECKWILYGAMFKAVNHDGALAAFSMRGNKYSSKSNGAITMEPLPRQRPFCLTLCE